MKRLAVREDLRVAIDLFLRFVCRIQTGFKQQVLVVRPHQPVLFLTLGKFALKDHFEKFATFSDLACRLFAITDSSHDFSGEDSVVQVVPIGGVTVAGAESTDRHTGWLGQELEFIFGEGFVGESAFLCHRL